jgi:hypothetical protein
MRLQFRDSLEKFNAQTILNYLVKLKNDNYKNSPRFTKINNRELVLSSTELLNKNKNQSLFQ